MNIYINNTSNNKGGGVRSMGRGWGVLGSEW